MSTLWNIHVNKEIKNGHCSLNFLSLFYLPPGSPEGDHNLHHVRVYVHACVRACVTQFSLKLLQLHIFGKSQVLMNFFALQYFWGLVNFGLLLSE